MDKKRINYVIDQDFYDQIKAKANGNGMTVSGYLTDVVQSDLHPETGSNIKQKTDLERLIASDEKNKREILEGIKTIIDLLNDLSSAKNSPDIKGIRRSLTNDLSTILRKLDANSKAIRSLKK